MLKFIICITEMFNHRQNNVLSPPLDTQRFTNNKNFQQNFQMLSPPPDNQRFNNKRTFQQDYYERYDRRDNDQNYDQYQFNQHRDLNTNIQSLNNKLPNYISLDVSELMQIKGIHQLYSLLTGILNECDENDSNRRLLAPAIAVCVDYVLTEQNYYRINLSNPKRKYKIYYRMGRIEYEVSFIKVSDDISTEEREIKISEYDITGLPKLSEVLVTGILLDSDAIDNRLTKMKLKKLSLKFDSYNFEADTDKLIKNLFRDLFKIQKIEDDSGWVKLIRLYLLGIIMMIKFNSKRKSNNKVQDQDDRKVYNTLVKSKEIREILISVINEDYKNESEVADDEDYIIA